MENTREIENYKGLVDLVRKGSIVNEKKARELAEEHGFDLNSLEEALLSGCKVKFERYAFMLSRGVTVYEEQARGLAERQGWDLDQAVERYESLDRTIKGYKRARKIA